MNVSALDGGKMRAARLKVRLWTAAGHSVREIAAGLRKQGFARVSHMSVFRYLRRLAKQGKRPGQVEL